MTEIERDGHEEDCASCRGPNPCDCGWTVQWALAEVKRLREAIGEVIDADDVRHYLPRELRAKLTDALND